MIWYSKKNGESFILENAFEQKKYKPGLKFNPGLALSSLQTPLPWLLVHILYHWATEDSWKLRPLINLARIMWQAS